MTRDINFVRERRRSVQQLTHGDRRMLGIGAATLIMGILLSIGSWTASWYTQKQLQQWLERQREVREQIRSNQAAEEQLAIFARKLKLLSDLERNRKDKGQVIERVQQTFGNYALVETITLNPATNIIVFHLTVNSATDFTEVMRLSNTEEVRRQFKTFALSNLSRDRTGAYSLNLTVAL